MQIMHQNDEITIKIKNLNERFRCNNILAVSRINKLTKREITSRTHGYLSVIYRRHVVW